VYPYLLDLGRVNLPLLGETHLYLPTYGVFFALAVLAGWLIWITLLRREGVPVQRAADVGFWTIIAGLVGAKLALYLVEWRDYLANPALILETLRSAGVVWGGVLAGLAVFVWGVRRAALPLGPVVDTAAVAVPVSQAIGRLGCFMAGCCWGRQCELPFAVTFGGAAHENTGVPEGVPLHPVQLYESAGNLLVAFLTFLAYLRPGRRPGLALLVYLGLYSALRFTVEFFRGDAARGVHLEGLVPGGLSTGQITSLLVLVAVLALLPRFLRGPRRGAEAGPEGKEAAPR
jgi:phosphatidylglycerol:prolipoprotein diacylglycerol transferase